MNTFIYTALGAVVLVAYLIWRKNAALKAKEEIAPQLDKLLGEKQLSDKIRTTLFYTWDISASYKLFFVLLRAVFSQPEHVEKEKLNSHQKELRDKAKVLLMKMFITNARLMPITYLIFIISAFFYFVLSARINRLTRHLKEGIDAYMKEPHIN